MQPHSKKYLLLRGGARYALTLIVASWKLSCLAETTIEAPAAVDIGQVPIGTEKDFKLVVKNVSGQKAQIVEISPSCSCTQVELTGSKTLMPGGEITVTGKVQFPLKTTADQTAVRIAYKVGDAPQCVAESIIKGMVVSALAMDRTPVDFGEVEESGSPRVASIKIQSGNSGQRWDRIELAVPSEHIQAKLDDVGNETKQLTITFSPKGLPIGIYRENIAIHLFEGGKEVNESASVSLTAHIQGPLKASPHTVNLGAVPPNEPCMRTVDLKSDASSLDAMIVKTPEGVVVKVLDVGKGEKRLLISMKSPAVSGYFIDAVTVEDTDTRAVLRIPILGSVKIQP